MFEACPCASDFVSADGGVNGADPGFRGEVVEASGADDFVEHAVVVEGLKADIFDLTVGNIGGEAGGAGATGSSEGEGGSDAFGALAAVGVLAGVLEADPEPFGCSG